MTTLLDMSETTLEKTSEDGNMVAPHEAEAVEEPLTALKLLTIVVALVFSLFLVSSGSTKRVGTICTNT